MGELGDQHILKITLSDSSIICCRRSYKSLIIYFIAKQKGKEKKRKHLRKRVLGRRMTILQVIFPSGNHAPQMVFTNEFGSCVGDFYYTRERGKLEIVSLEILR